MKSLFVIPLLWAGYCANGTIANGQPRVKGGNWPLYRERIYYDGDGAKQIFITEFAHASHGSAVQLVEITRGANGNPEASCVTRYGEAEDFLSRVCDHAAGTESRTNSFDLQGRLISSVDQQPNKAVATSLQVEYSGKSEIYRMYRSGKLELTTLGERHAGGIKYTTWDHNPGAPSIHVRDYDDIGEGRELYVSGGPNPRHEISRTRVFRSNLQKIIMAHEFTANYPHGVVTIVYAGLDVAKNKHFTKNYELLHSEFQLDSVSDFAAALSIVLKSRLTYEVNDYLKEKPPKSQI